MLQPQLEVTRTASSSSSSLAFDKHNNPSEDAESMPTEADEEAGDNSESRIDGSEEEGGLITRPEGANWTTVTSSE
jgi:hypothetical protein